MIAVLYAIENGPYAIPGVDLWGMSRDARKYKGPYRVIAHPPCERWGRYWGGGPMLHGTDRQKLMGDDDGCFAHAIWAVRTFGGLLEHPEASHGFKFFGLPIPDQRGGWSLPDRYGGRSCCVAQGHYGHMAQKLTWLYGININFKDLVWGRCHGKQRLDEGFHSSEEREKKTDRRNRTNKLQNTETPVEFRDLLLEMVRN